VPCREYVVPLRESTEASLSFPTVMLLEKLPRACRLRGSGVGERPPLSRGLALSMGLVVALAAKRDVFRRLFGLLNGGFVS
jgi:hypothetical protein